MRNYQDPQYKKWRKDIYTRDEYKCQWPNCLYSGKKINAHHIKKWSDFPGLRFHPSNGITLCYNHHKLIKDNESSYELFFLKLIANKNELS